MIYQIVFLYLFYTELESSCQLRNKNCVGKCENSTVIVKFCAFNYCPAKLVSIRNNRNWTEISFDTIRNNMFVSVVSVLYRNSVFWCFDWTETKQKQPKQTEKNAINYVIVLRNKQKPFKLVLIFLYLFYDHVMCTKA
jgi:hypothetical protein